MNVREWALPVYTILTQLAAGALLVLWLIRLFAVSKFSPREMDRIIKNPILVIAFTVVVAMGGAHFHLSKPFHSYLAVINFRTSWLSREIVFTVLFFLTLMALVYLVHFYTEHRRLISFLGWLAILLGSFLIYCMARIYIIPTQVLWNSNTVILSFYTTALMLGTLAVVFLMILDLKFSEITRSNDVGLRSEVVRYSSAGLTRLTVALGVLSFGIAYIQILTVVRGEHLARMSLNLLLELYLPLLVIRFLLLVIALSGLVYAVIRMYSLGSISQRLLLPVYLSFLTITISEIINRFLFYAIHIRVGL